jgi:hypothetical protein
MFAQTGFAKPGACSAQTLRGAYVGTHTGSSVVTITLPNGTKLAPAPYEMLSLIVFDGQGHATGTLTGILYGVALKGTYSDFTYEVNADCTVKLKFTTVSAGIPGVMPPLVIPACHEGVVLWPGDEAYLIGQTACTPDGQGPVLEMVRTVLKRIGPASWW